jgi:hypothetical protein
LDDPQLGKRTYHEQHFFCAECGDPFLPPSIPASKGEIAFSGDGAFVSDDVGFTVYRGHPYCEACHVRLRLPKCKRCKRSIRDGDEAVEALGGKWCWGCFCCAVSIPAFSFLKFSLPESRDARNPSRIHLSLRGRENPGASHASPSCYGTSCNVLIHCFVFLTLATIP